MGSRHQDCRARRSSRHTDSLTHTAQSDEGQALDQILSVRCYFCALAGSATRARSFRDVWICSECYATPEAREILASTHGFSSREEVQ
jgi:hypothetical protein